MELARSERLVLLRLSPDDLEAFQSCRSDPEVARYQGWEAMDEAQALGFLKHCSSAPLLQLGKWCQIGLAQRATGALIGDIGLCLSDDGTEAELGITLSTAAQGKGLGFEAVEMVCTWLFAQSGITRIIAITHAQNAPALALLARSRFVHTHDTCDEIDGVPTPERWFERRRPV